MAKMKNLFLREDCKGGGTTEENADNQNRPLLVMFVVNSSEEFLPTQLRLLTVSPLLPLLSLRHNLKSEKQFDLFKFSS